VRAGLFETLIPELIFCIVFDKEREMAVVREITKSVYPTENRGQLSIQDMLTYFEQMGTMRVSDLHLKVGAPPMYRVDGDLEKLKGPDLTQEVAEQLILPLLSQNSADKLRELHSVDCSYRLAATHFRINVFKENDGICAAIRALSADILPVEKTGFPNDIWKDIINRKHGLVLVTGVTGAGKSTTIASMINRISEERACRIITIEDPIEYIFDQKKALVSQREIGKDVYSFIDGLRSMLREDPNIILVGEMRDAETIAMTLMAAETGHLVFSTLHTRDTAGTIMRILDYFPSGRQSEVRNQLSLGLAYIISQKLIPRKDGKGRIAAMEILNNNYATANLIRTGKVEQIYSQLQTKTSNRYDEKMITMERHLARLVKADMIELEEAQKWANNPTTFAEALNLE
jgi:twitching motility protein PilT